MWRGGDVISITGEMFRFPDEAHWLGKMTEGNPVYRDQKNPITRVYSKRQLRAIFEQTEIDPFE